MNREKKNKDELVNIMSGMTKQNLSIKSANLSSLLNFYLPIMGVSSRLSKLFELVHGSM